MREAATTPEPTPVVAVRAHSVLGVRLAGFAAAVAVLVLVVLVSLAVGVKSIPLGTVLDAVLHGRGGGDRDVIVDLRLPRTLLGVAAGAALAAAGVLMQALTRNPLADPGILGVNAGAAFAVVVSIWIWRFADFTAYVWFAFAGAGIASILVYLLGSRGRSGATPVRLALAGTAVSAVLGALISFITLLEPKVFDQFRFWGVGSLTGADRGVVWQVLPFLAAGSLLALGLSGALNALALGDETARGLGSRIGRTRVLGAVAVTLLCGAATAAVGPIAFVGLTVPHIARAVTGPDHRWVTPYSLVLGPILLLGGDIVGRLVARPAEVQAGIVTAFVGAPVFIALVRRRRVREL
ncbi:iron chelate uptake ABC transporter family permease subunit [Dactylosporangium fulvum]|uniref:Iron chelate uptake ABC transporter family permease subunit n=1 Tax=Dactylosporangium fulvum TaxID=53359 RepID=A0ABY5VYD4_9ACTN|nr:iron chelate uptake ABC transporter family permease subunit [Dactylosporangium fulvum]UWP82146.1 iron chelate uptake ABC transporter family permease subunit [Dactylosporangium fulvum]